ncbi:lipoma-preferred partner homolog isoform X2 [Lampetra planeri]
MSGPTWISPKNATGVVAAGGVGDIVTLSLAQVEHDAFPSVPGEHALSCSAPVGSGPQRPGPPVAPKPKHNPYKGGTGDYPPPPPPPPPEEPSYRSEALAGNYPPPPPPPPPLPGAFATLPGRANPWTDSMQGTAKKSGYRPTSIDMEIDSLTNMLADMESNSPFPSRSRPTYSNTLPSPPPAADSTANTLPSSRPTMASSYTQASPSVAASKSTSGPPPAYSNGRSARPQPQAQPQPVAASYATAPARPPTNVQVRVAQPSHSYVGPAATVYAPSPARQPEPAYSAQQQRPGEPQATYGPGRPVEAPYTYRLPPSRQAEVQHQPLQHQTQQQQHHPPPPPQLQQQQQQRPGEVQSAYGAARPVDPGYGSRYGDQGQGHTANRQQAEPAYAPAYNAGSARYQEPGYTSNAMPRPPAAQNYAPKQEQAFPSAQQQHQQQQRPPQRLDYQQQPPSHGQAPAVGYPPGQHQASAYSQAQAPAYHQPPQGQLAMSGYTPGQHQASAYAPAQLKKAYHSDDLPPSVPGSAQQTRTLLVQGGGGGGAPTMGVSGLEDEVDRLTKKMLHDMNNPPSEEYFGKCARCGENVVGDGNGCTAMEQVFHVDCFTCLTCNARLRGQPFYAVEGKAYCEGCYINMLERCSVCSQPIMDRILRATGKAYHPQCFTCVVCRKSLDGVPFTVDATNQIHCIEDFHRKFAPRCSVCQHPIMPEPGQEETVRIVALDRSFHVHCYKCEDCGLVLSSESEGRGCYPLDSHILCRNCNGRRIQALSANITTDL